MKETNEHLNENLKLFDILQKEYNISFIEFVDFADKEILKYKRDLKLKKLL